MVAKVQGSVLVLVLLTVALGPSVAADGPPSDLPIAAGAGPADVVLNACQGAGAVAVALHPVGGIASVYADNAFCAFYIEVGNCVGSDEGALHCRDDTAYGVVALNVTADGHLRFDAGFPGGTAAVEGDIVWS